MRSWRLRGGRCDVKCTVWVQFGGGKTLHPHVLSFYKIYRALKNLHVLLRKIRSDTQGMQTRKLQTGNERIFITSTMISMETP